MRLLLLIGSLALISFAQRPDLVTEVRTDLSSANFSKAGQAIATYKAANGVDSTYLEALSWMARGQFEVKNYAEADRYALDVIRLSLAQLFKRDLDADSALPTAVGAAIEVHAQILNIQNQKSEALAFLREQMDRYRKTSIRPRIQKTINLIGLEGKSAFPLDEQEYIGPKPLPLARYRGSPVLLFFWAHWCGECKAEVPILARLQKEYAAKGLVILAPTQRYGYIARGEEASRDDEFKYIGDVWLKHYSALSNVPVPVSEENFRVWGCSTTPTIVLIDKAGIVRLYHPGDMTYAELEPKVEALFAGK
jgi:thiol-disulfide isomerase/thioredoxin